MHNSELVPVGYTQMAKTQSSSKELTRLKEIDMLKKKNAKLPVQVESNTVVEMQ